MNVPFTLKHFLDRAALVAADEVALVDEPGSPADLGTITWSQLATRATGMALALEELGIAPGERVAIVSPNSGAMLVSFFGVAGHGRVLVPINFRLSAAEIAYIVEHSGARVLLFDPELADEVAGITVEHTICLDAAALRTLFAPAVPGRLPAAVELSEEDTATINYTSGTTARPKGVQLTHRNLWTNATAFGWHMTITPDDVLLHTLPLFHVNGWGVPFALAGMGGRNVMLRKVDGEEILKRVECEGVTILCGAPAVVAMILAAAQARQAAGLVVPGRGEVRMVVAGAPPPSAVIAQFEDLLGWEFIQIYGLTETSPLLTVNRAPKSWSKLDASERSMRLSRAGVPAIGVEVAIDAEGEVLARSNHVFAGYWEQPEATAQAIRDGWFHTGDGGYLDEAYTVISDRKKDVIITGGENVSSIEVEDVLFRHADVAECCVIGVPDEKWGETVLALVVLREGAQASDSDLIAHCRELMAHFKCPTRIEFRGELARTATGKLQKFILRAPYWEGHEKLVN